MTKLDRFILRVSEQSKIHFIRGACNRAVAGLYLKLSVSSGDFWGVIWSIPQGGGQIPPRMIFSGNISLDYTQSDCIATCQIQMYCMVSLEELIFLIFKDSMHYTYRFQSF